MPDSQQLPRLSVTAEWLDDVHREIGRLLWKVEERFGDNPPGTYPSEVEMTLRLAWTAAGRAGKQMRMDPIEPINPPETVAADA